jgi:hypothetical protein
MNMNATLGNTRYVATLLSELQKVSRLDVTVESETGDRL